jgi:predicted ATP-grasp superfamily ATP-dependent carboligase
LHYYQRRVRGEAVSALVLGHGGEGLVLGFSTQWVAPTLEKPFRFGGAARPAELGPRIVARLAAAVRRLIAALPLKGLNSIDFLVDGDDFWLLEINPRPGATLDIFEPAQGSLFAWHVCACAGLLPQQVRIPEAATAIAIVYAEEDVAVTPGLDWPQWTADRPRAGTIVRAGDPLCTVFARAATAAESRRLVTARAERILQWTRAKAA